MGNVVFICTDTAPLVPLSGVSLHSGHEKTHEYPLPWPPKIKRNQTITKMLRLLHIWYSDNGTKKYFLLLAVFFLKNTFDWHAWNQANENRWTSLVFRLWLGFFQWKISEDFNPQMQFFINCVCLLVMAIFCDHFEE